MAKTIKQPTLFLRSGYFIDKLKSLTKLGFGKIEERIRVNQYNGGEHCEDTYLLAPPYDTIRDYFRLYRSVAFEPNEKAKFAPWLLAAELEFPGSSSAFFHPIFDLLFGELESSFFWAAKFRRIPNRWIESARTRGDEKIAHEWELMNEATKTRKHRTKPTTSIDTLSLAHLSLLRLPSEIKDVLFDGNGSNPNWTRRYSSIESEISHLQSIRTMESLAALLALVIEATEIRDSNRFNLAKAALLKQMNFMDAEPACKRIKHRLKEAIIYKCNELYVHEYNGFLHFGFGLPVSWRAIEMEKFLPKPPTSKD